MTFSECIKTYNELTEFEKEICQAVAAFSELDGRHYFRNFLLLTGFKDDKNNMFSERLINDTLNKLIDKQLIRSDLSVPKTVLHQLTIQACTGKNKVAFLDAHIAIKERHAGIYVERNALYACYFRLQFYFAVENGIDVSEWEKVTAHSDFEYMVRRSIVPFVNDPVWLEKIYPPALIIIYKHLLNEFLDGDTILIPVQSILTNLQIHAKNGSSAAAKILIDHAIHTADLRNIQQSWVDALDQNEDPKLIATILFLQGQQDKAYAAFETALKASKKRLRTRKYCFHGIFGIYYLLCLLINKEFHTALEAVLVAIGNSMNKHKPVFESFQRLILFLTLGNNPHKGKLDQKILTAFPYCKAFLLLVQYWMDRASIKQGLFTLEPAFESLKIFYPGIARIIADVLSREFPDSNKYSNYLDETRNINAISFCDIVPVKEEWEHALNLLEELYAADDSAKLGFDNKGLRLAWVVDLKPPCKVMGALEQKINAKGQWSKGKAVSLERLKTDNQALDYATDHDHRVVNTITSTISPYGRYGKTEYSFQHGKTLKALIGHPNIIDADLNTPVEFVQGSIELHVQEKGEHFSLGFSHQCIELITHVQKETSTRYQIFEVTEDHVNIQRALGSENEMLIPKKSKKRLSSVVTAIAKKMPVCSQLDESCPQKDGNVEPCLQITPLNVGIKINLFTYPFGEHGPSFKPGVGFPTPHAIIKGKSQRVLRNLEEETKQANLLVQNVALLSQFDSGQGEWIFDQPQDALELLSHLQDYPNPLKIFWPSGKKLNVSSATTAKSLSLRIQGDRDWFALEGQLKVGENQVIELKQLLDLLDTHSGRFIPVNDSQFLALSHHFERQLREFKAIAETTQGKIRIHSLSTEALSEMIEETHLKCDAHWQAVKERLQNMKKHVPVLPTTLQANLRSYQLEGFQWLSCLANWGVGACLADDMGLGKTLQAIALILECASSGPTLVITPTSVCHNWVSECLKFAPTLTPIIHAQNRNLSNLGPMQLLITSYGLLTQDIDQLSKIQWEIIILDEAQSIKNMNTKRSQSVMQLEGKTKLILTGTPIENRLSDIWNLFRFINPGLLGSQESFQKRFIDPIEQHKNANARQALKKLIQPFILRRLKNQVLTELPPRIEKTIFVPMSSEYQAFYEALRRTAVEKLADMSAKETKRIHILAEITRLRRACCDPSLVLPDTEISGTKIDMLLELVEELRANKHRALVFSQFVGFLEKVAAKLSEKNISFQYLDGSTPQEERQKRVKAFQAGEGDLFLISLKAGGTGLNLTAADYVIHLDPWWNPAVEDQASDRAHRIGQTRPVTIYRLITQGTIEEKMIQLHNDKRTLASDLLEGADMNGKLNDEELLAMLST